MRAPRVVAVVAAMAALCLAAVPAADARHRSKGPAASVRILSGDTRGVLRSGRFRLVVRYRTSGAVRLRVRAGRPGGRRRLPFARTRIVRFRRGGRKRVTLRLTRRGAAFLRARVLGCARTPVAVFARAHRHRRIRSRNLFSPRNRIGRLRQTRRVRTLVATRGRCRRGGGRRPGGGTPGGGPGGGVPGGGPPGGGPGGGGPGGGSTLRAGAANGDMTPPVGTPMFAYTARSGVANPGNLFPMLSNPDQNLYAKSFVKTKGIHTRVRARSLVIEQRGRRFALVQVDLGGLPYALVQEVMKRIQGTGITAERLMISATHTHSSTGPIWPADSGGYAALGGDAFDPRIFEITAQSVAESIRAAAGRLEPARIGVGAAELRGASRNRNFGPFLLNDDVPADDAEALAASIDPTVAAIRVDDLQGRPIAVWSNFAAHQTSFGDENLNFSGDNAATAARSADAAIAREAAARGDAPPAGRPPVTVWTNGNEGDISPNGDPEPSELRDEPLQYVESDEAKANMAGSRIGDGVVRAWRDAGRSMGQVPIAARRTFLTFDGDQEAGDFVGPVPVLGQGGIVADDGTCSPVNNAAGPGQGKKAPALFGPGLVPQTAPVSLWRIGPFGIVSYPTEINRWMGKRIIDRLKADSGLAFQRVVVANLTNGYQSYASTPEEYDACHYEGSFTLFGRLQGPRMLLSARPLVGPLLSGAPAPPGDLEPPPTSFTTPNAAPLDPTPDAGNPVTPPSGMVIRHGRATFTWKGGDPAVDAPRGRTFVSLQRDFAPGPETDWRTVATEDGPSDTTVWDDNAKTWTDTWQFATCDPPGTYRFAVRGRAVRSGATVEDYTVESQPFQLHPIDDIQLIDPPTVSPEGTARVRARYPNPGPALLALPRRVRSGQAILTVQEGTSTREVLAEPDAARLAFTAQVQPGATITGVRVEDSCGNTGP